MISQKFENSQRHTVARTPIYQIPQTRACAVPILPGGSVQKRSKNRAVFFLWGTMREGHSLNALPCRGQAGRQAGPRHPVQPRWYCNNVPYARPPFALPAAALRSYMAAQAVPHCCAYTEAVSRAGKNKQQQLQRKSSRPSSSLDSIYLFIYYFFSTTRSAGGNQIATYI